MRTAFLFLLLLITWTTFAQQHKTKNIIIVTVDGYRWQEIFRGADSAKLFGRRFTSQDSVWRTGKYWADDKQERRKKLMPLCPDHRSPAGI